MKLKTLNERFHTETNPEHDELHTELNNSLIAKIYRIAEPRYFDPAETKDLADLFINKMMLVIPQDEGDKEEEQLRKDILKEAGKVFLNPTQHNAMEFRIKLGKFWREMTL